MSRLEKLVQKPTNVYSRTEDEREPKNIHWFWVVLVVFFISGITYLLFFTPWLKIKDVEVSGYKHPETVLEVVGEQRQRNIISNNILFFNTSALKSALLGDPKIIDVKVVKKLPAKLRIEITEAKPALIWASAGEKYLVDERGVVMGKWAGENLPVVYDGANINVESGDRVASPTFIKFINDISAGFEPATGTKLAKILIMDLLTDVHLVSADGWTVYIDATKSPEAGLKDLTKVLEEARKNKKKLEYIDMRLDNRIFYK